MTQLLGYGNPWVILSLTLKEDVFMTALQIAQKKINQIQLRDSSATDLLSLTFKEDVFMTALQIAQDKINQLQLRDSSATDLDLSRCSLTTEGLEQLIRNNRVFFSNIKLLSLVGNDLSSLPKSIGLLTKLTYLSLVGNKLSSLPESIKKLTKLRNLYLDNNKLRTVPESIKKLTKLTKLSLFNNPLDNNTLSFLRNMEDSMVSSNRNARVYIHTNMSAHEKVSDWKGIFTDMPEYKYNATFIKVIESDLALQEFITKARFPKLYRINKQEMIIGLDFLFKALLDPGSKNHHIRAMKIHATNCSAPVATYVIERYLESCAQQNKKPTTGFVERHAIYSFISKNAKKLKLEDNEIIEQAHGLLNALFLKNSETYSHNKCKISRGDIINYRLPSIANLLILAFDEVRDETAKAFAELLCKTNETGELKKDDKGYYILDGTKYKKIISDNMPDFMQPEFINFVDGAMERLNCILETHQYDIEFGDILNLFRDNNLKVNNGRSNLIRNAQLQPEQMLEKMESNLENYLTNLEKELQVIPKIDVTHNNAIFMNIFQSAQDRINQVKSQGTSGTTLNLSLRPLTTEVLQELIRKNSDFFATLTHLYLRYNELTSLPKKIEDLRNLKDFDVSYNPLNDNARNFLSDMEKNNPNIKITQNTVNSPNVERILGTGFSGQSRQFYPR